MASNDIGQRPIFKRLRGEYRIARLSIPAALAVAVTAFVGLAVAAGLGAVKVDVEVPYASYEVESTTRHYENMATQLASIELQQEVDAESGAQTSLNAEQEKLIEDCRRLGIKSNMSRFEIEALVPTSHTESTEAMPLWARALLFLLLPTGAAYVLLFEDDTRTTFLKEMRRRARFRGSQRSYRCAPREYAARERD